MLKKISLTILTAILLSISASALAADYLGNLRSMKFHYSSCRTIKHPENFVQLSSRDEAVSAGYIPYKVCRP